MNVYIYNDSFISLLNLIKILFKNKVKPDNIKNSDYTGDLFANLIKLDIEEDSKVISEFIKYFNHYHFNLIYYVFLSNEENKELIIYYFLLNYFKYRENLTRMRNLKCVSEVLRISKKVKNEAHKMKGFTRFKELKNNVLYAEINPDNDILFPLSIHFKRRLSNEYWLIKDVNHHLVSIYDRKDFYIVKEDDVKIEEILSTKEELFKDLWCTFYKTVGIKERKNDRCRMNFMPKKYWNYLCEVEGEL